MSYILYIYTFVYYSIYTQSGYTLNAKSEHSVFTVSI